MKTPLNWLKNVIKKIEGNFNETIKHCPKSNVYKFLIGNVLYGLLLDASAIQRSVLGGNRNWDLKLMSPIEMSAIKCLLHISFVMSV